MKKTLLAFVLPLASVAYGLPTQDSVPLEVQAYRSLPAVSLKCVLFSTPGRGQWVSVLNGKADGVPVPTKVNTVFFFSPWDKAFAEAGSENGEAFTAIGRLGNDGEFLWIERVEQER